MTNFSQMKDTKLNDTIDRLSLKAETYINILSDPTICQAGEDKYGNYRGFCTLCQEKCPSYIQTGLDELNCAKCFCGASAHKLLSLDQSDITAFAASVKKDIFPKINQSISDNQLNFNCFCVMYKMIDKNANKNQFSWLFQLLREGGFKILKVDIKMLKDENDKGILNNLNENLNNFYNRAQNNIKNMLNSSVTFNKYNMNQALLEKNTKGKKDTTFKSLAKIDAKFKFLTYDETNNFKNSGMKSLNQNESINLSLRGTNLYKSFMTQNMKSIIYSKIEDNKQYYDEFNNPILIICLSCDTENNINYFEKFNYAINHSDSAIKHLTNTLKLLYYSRSKISALWDIQVLFPELFQISKVCQLITSKPNYSSQFHKAISIYQDSLLINSMNLIGKCSYATFADLKVQHPFYSHDKSCQESSSCVYQLNYIGYSEPNQMATTLGFNPYLDIINYSLKSDYLAISNEFFADNVQYERALVIFRPFLLRNGLSDIILNIFRINGFQVLTRKTTVLTKEQLSYLYNRDFPLFKIDYEDYEHMMTDSNCELIILSKFGAVQDINTLLGFNQKEINVNLYNSLKSNLSYAQLKVDYELTSNILKKNNQVSKEDLSEIFIPKEQPKSLHCFKDITSLLNVSSIMTEITKEKQRLNIGNFYTLLQTIKTNLLKIASYCNLFAYNSRESSIAQEDVNYFFPYYGEMEEALLLIRDFPITKSVLEKMKYEIVNHKAIRLNEEDFERLFDEYLSSDHVTPFDYASSKDYLLSNDVYLIRVVKPGGYYELKKIIAKENHLFLINQYTQQNTLDYITQLKQNAYLIDNSINIEYFYPILNDKIRIIEGSDLEANQQSIVIQVLNSCLKCTVGENLRFDNDVSLREIPLIERYIHFYHFDMNEKEKEYFLAALHKYMFPYFNKDESIYSMIESKFYEVIKYKQSSIIPALSYFIESNALGFYEIRIPILEKIASNGWIYIDMKDLIIKRNYLYIDNNFYNELVVKNNSLILHSLFPFDKESLGAFFNYRFTSEAINKSAFTINSVALNKANLDNLKSSFNFTNNETEIQRRILYMTKYESTKQFYKSCIANDQHHYHIVPQNYHYRIKPEDIYMNIARIYEVEEFGGLFFLEVVIQDFMKFRLPEQNNKIENDSILAYTNPFISDYGNSDMQLSLPGFLWGKKLMNLCFNVENMEGCPVENYGPVIYIPNKQKITGVINSANIKEYEMYLYVNIVDDIKSSKFAFCSDKDIDFIEQRLIEILNSDIFTQTRTIENARLMPSRITETNLRINKNKPEIENKNKKNDKSKMTKSGNNYNTIDPKHEILFHSMFKEKEKNDMANNLYASISMGNSMNMSNMDMSMNSLNETIINDTIPNKNDFITNNIMSKNIVLIDIFCYIGMKYHMYASILFLLKVYYKKISRKTHLITLAVESTDKIESEYERLINAMIQGFESHSHINYSAFNDVNRYNAYNIEYFLLCLRELKFTMNESELLQEKLTRLNQFLTTKTEKDSEYDELFALSEQLRKNYNENQLAMEIIFNETKECPLQQSVEDLDNYEYKYAPKERYHIPMYMKEKWERNMQNEKYVRTIKVNQQLHNNLDNSKRENKRNLSASTGFEVKNDFYLVQKSLLREPEPVPDKRILLSKKKNDKKESQSTKLFSEYMNDLIEDEMIKELKKIEGNVGAQTHLTYDEYLIHLEKKIKEGTIKIGQVPGTGIKNKFAMSSINK